MQKGVRHPGADALLSTSIQSRPCRMMLGTFANCPQEQVSTYRMAGFLDRHVHKCCGVMALAHRQAC